MAAAVAFVVAVQNSGVGSQVIAVLSASATFHSALFLYAHIYLYVCSVFLPFSLRTRRNFSV